MSSDLHPTNHELWRLVQARVKEPKPMSQIAAELGYDIDELCAWIMAYREPHKAKPYNNRHSPAITLSGRAIHDHWSMSRQGQAYDNWRRARDGAVKARAE